MDLNSYLSCPGAMTVAAIRQKMLVLGYPVKSDAQIRQWQHQYRNRIPSPANSMGLELATEGAVRRQSTRPDDYWLIWPELALPDTVCEQSDCSQERSSDHA